MDLTSITDLQELKAMAYDQLVSKQLAERNLVMLTQRISELSSSASDAQPTQP